MGDTEEYFPRGGKKATPVRFKQSSNFLGGITREERKKKKSKNKKHLENDDGYLSEELVTEVDNSYKNCGLWLSNKVVREGQLMLGRVREVLDTKMSISLPCRMLGQVMACHISEAYNEQLEAYVNDQIDHVCELSKMFRHGQYVVVKVLEVSSDKGLMLSLMPQHVNSDKKHSELRKGTILQAAVKSVEDHGYIMDIGVRNAKVFLAKEVANPELELETGGLCWVVVKSISSSPESSVVTVSGTLHHLQRTLQRFSTSTNLMPGTALEFTVDKPLDNGIEGHILDNVTAYIQRHHVDNATGKKPKLGQKIRARLLYTIPPQNIPFLTMRDIFETTYPDVAAEQKLKVGDIIEDARVVKIMGRSVYMKLGEGGLGLLTVRRVRVDENLTDEEIIAQYHPIGSARRVRVLGYNLLDGLYSVSNDRAVLQERYFRLDQVEVGEMLTATITEVADEHLRVSVGRLKGYISETHMTEAGIYVDPKKSTSSQLSKKKFRVGQKVQCRVLSVNIDRNNLVLTLKSSLLDPQLEVLASYEQARVGRAYTGVITHIRDYLLVSFFNRVTAYVPGMFVTSEPVDNFADIFHVGQIVKCTILSVKVPEKKMSASLTTAPFDPDEKRQPTKRKNDDTHKGNVKKAKLDETLQEDKKSDDSVEVKKKDKKKKKEKEQTDESDAMVTEEPEDKISDDSVEVKKKKKKKKKEKEQTDESDAMVTEEPEDKISDDSVEVKKKKKKKKKEKEQTDESDAIVTDEPEEPDILTPQDLHLIDFSDCVTEKNYKKRVVSLVKSIKARTHRLNRIDEKITRIETNGLTSKNKKYHTAMHAEKLVVQERIRKLKEALEIGQNKLKELNVEFNIDCKKLKIDKTQKTQETQETQETKTDSVESKKKKKKTKEEIKVEPEVEIKKEKKKTNRKEIPVLDTSKPVIQAPSAKEFWSQTVQTPALDKEESSSGDEEEDEKPKKKRKKLSPAEKVAKAREEEERLRELERRATDSDAAPRSNDQFQRALLASPDCSQLWIAYMAFHLQATEIEKARAVARKALATINFREEDERLNVWLALLNLEHRFGTKESQQKTLEEALQMNDTYKVHTKLLDILVDTGKGQELSSLVELMMRRYRGSPDVYRVCGAACYKAGLLEKARQVMQKGISALEKKEHVDLLVSFAKLERGAGERERAEALFEQVLAVYPQRVDVAAAYTDMLLKSAGADQARQVLDRLTSLQLPARKMKVLYKKWIEMEEKIGDENHIQSVRQRAKEFLKKAKF